MVRKVFFRTLIEPMSAGYDINQTSEQTFLYTAEQHGKHGSGLSLVSPNIEITVPDTWGGTTLSMQKVDKGVGHYFTALAENISLNILFMAGGDINKYYQLRDRFARMWGAGEFELGIQTGDYHGGMQWVKGYLSTISFNEFRTNSDVKATATFVPTTPWYFTYSQWGKLLPLSSLPLLSGEAGDTGGVGTVINCNFFECERIVGATGLVFSSIDKANQHYMTDVEVHPSDYSKTPDYYQVLNGMCYGFVHPAGSQSASDPSLIDDSISVGEVALPDPLTSVAILGSGVTVSTLRYGETYPTNDVLQY